MVPAVKPHTESVLNWTDYQKKSRFHGIILSRVIFHSRRKRFLREAAAFLLLAASASALSAGAQVAASGNSGQPAASAPGSSVAGGASKLTFDAASIRPSSQKFFLKGYDFLDPVSNAAPPQGGLFSWNVQMGLAH